MLRRRPSAAMLIALLALFVALGGPAEAQRFINGKLLKQGTVTSGAIKNRTIKTRDLGKRTVRELRRTPIGGVHEAHIANGAVTPGKLARGAVGPAALAGNAVGGAHVADSSLDARDIGRFWGHFSVTLPPIPTNTCWSGEPVGLAPERSRADISRDVVLVTPGEQWPDKQLTLTVRHSSRHDRFVLVACNPTSGPVASERVDLNYVIIGVP